MVLMLHAGYRKSAMFDDARTGTSHAFGVAAWMAPERGWDGDDRRHLGLKTV